MEQTNLLLRVTTLTQPRRDPRVSGQRQDGTDDQAGVRSGWRSRDRRTSWGRSGVRQLRVRAPPAALPGGALIPLVLDHNLRSTWQDRPELRAAGAGVHRAARWGRGPEVEFIPTPLGRGDEAPRATPWSGCSTRVGSLRMSPCSPWAPDIRCNANARRRWASPRTGRSSGRTMTCSTATSWASRAWNAERSCCASTRTAPADRSRERLYVGISRATDRPLGRRPAGAGAHRRPRGARLPAVAVNRPRPQQPCHNRIEVATIVECR